MDAKDKPTSSYKVGYGCPPRETRFKKGRSGNPRGRPKGSQNLTTVLNRVFSERVTIPKHGRKITMTKLEYVAHQLVEKATAGDLRALQQALVLARLVEDRVPQKELEEALGEVDQRVLERILQRVQRTSKPGAGNDEADTH